VRLQPGPDAKVAAICEHLDVSFNGGVNIAIDGLDDASLEAIHTHGYEQGYRDGVAAGRAQGRAAGEAEAKRIYRLTVPCANCHEPIEIRHDDSSADSVLRVLIDRGIAHTTCPSQRE
jgi:hypothetical protein